MFKSLINRQLYKNVTFLYRGMSSATQNLTILEIDDKTKIAKLTLNRPPVNGLNLELLRDIQNDIQKVESNNCKGLILTSSSTSVFSAGLDILEMYKPDETRLREFWTTLQNVWLKLYGCGLPTAAAINGHSPAGGCLLAISCEYRAMLPNFTIGLNETQLGIVAPPWFVDTMLNVLPRRQAELALTQGKMFTTNEALNCGLVDSVASSKDEAIDKCTEFILSFSKINAEARALSKLQFRLDDLTNLQKNREKDLENFVKFSLRPDVQKGLGIYLESLKKKARN